MNLYCPGGGILQGDQSVPGDKSISHRAIMLGALAEGVTHIQGFLTGQDCLATLKILQQLGVKIERQDTDITIQGVGLKGLQASPDPLNCGNSGTSMRLLAGILAAQSFSSCLSGDPSLQQRPMRRIIEPLQQMGAQISGQKNGSDILPPLFMAGADQITGMQYTLPVASAQVKSCLLLAALYAQQPTRLIEKTPTRDHTERLLKAFGCRLALHGSEITLIPGVPLTGQTITVPGDFSAAAFFIVGASIKLGSHLILREVGINPTRTGLITILQAMGAQIVLHHPRLLGGEPIADIEVRGTHLQGTIVAHEQVASAIDEFPILFVAAACAQGKTVFSGIEELRHKESDRIAAMTKGLRELGITVEILPDGLIIYGKDRLAGGQVDSFGDHRVAMAFAIASLNASEPIVIQQCENISTSFPNFVALAQHLGLFLEQKT